MMAYDSQFVLCVLHNGHPVREIGGKVNLPFHSGYKVRLKNKNFDLRAKARVWIDGRQVSNLGDLILQPNETLDLERFIDESMTSGNKFEFVPLGDGRVNDPTEPENGIIKVEFYRELKPFTIQPITKWITGPCPSWQYTDTNSTAGNRTFSPDTTTFTTGGRGTSCSVNYVSHSVAPISDSAGATVEGGYSGQSFVYGSDFQTEMFPVTLTLRLSGIERGEMNWEDRPNTPRRPKKRIKFCPNCGAKRHGMSKFCASCGTAYHPRYERERGRIVR